MWLCRSQVASTSQVKFASAGLSSTIRISGVVFMDVIPIGRNCRQRESKCGSTSRLGVHPDPSPMLFHYFLADSQAYAIPGILCPGMQPLKDDKNLLFVLGGDADAVI